MKPTLLLSLLVMGSLTTLKSQSISVNFGAERTEGQPGGVTSAVADTGKFTGAIPIDGAFWNNLSGPTGPSGIGSSLIDSNGASVSVAMAWTSANTYFTGSTGATTTSENGDLTNGYLDDGGRGWLVSMASPYLLSDIYMITASADSTRLMPISVNGTYYKGNGAGGTVLAAGIDDPYTAVSFTASDTLVESDNYIKVLNQPTVILYSDRGSARAAIAGLQVKNAYTGTFSYWDTNGTDAASGNAGGAWSGANWSTDAEGLSATSNWTPGNTAVFSAGSDGIGNNTVTLSGTVAADAIWLKNGGLTVTGGTLDLSSGVGVVRAEGTNPLKIDSILSTGDYAAFVGFVDVNNAANSFGGKVSISGFVNINANQTFPELDGAGVLNIDQASTTVTVGNANNSNFGGRLLGQGVLSKTGTGTLLMSGTSPTFTGKVDILNGAVELVSDDEITWDLSGAGNLIKSGVGQITHTLQPTYTGDLTINGGILAYQLPAGTIDGKTITITGDNRLRQAGSAATDTLTLTNTTIGTSTADGIVDSRGGTLVFGNGTNAKVRAIAAGNGNVLIEDGANVTLRNFNIGDGSQTSAIINQTGGTVTMESGGFGVRVGHWGGAGRQYNLTGGTFNATAIADNGGEAAYVNLGWDGEGDMVVGGGANPALLQASGIRFDRNRVGAGVTSCTLTISPNGTVEVGSLGTQGLGNNDGIILNGGTISGVTSTTWMADLDAASSTSSTINVKSGVNVIQRRDFGGDGTLTKTGPGTFVVNTGAIGAFQGDFNVAEGTLQVAGDSVGTGLVTVQSGGNIQPGIPSAPGSGTVDSLNLQAGSSTTFRVGGAVDDQLAVYTNNGFTVVSSEIILQPVTTFTVGDTFTLIDYEGTIQGSGFAGLSLSSSNPHYVLSLVNNVANTSVDVRVDSVSEIRWTGANSNIWDLNTSSNFNDGAASKFYELDVVNFNDLDPSESVVLSGNISPTLIRLNNSTATTYTFSGDSIMGFGGIVKTGTGAAIFTNDNSFTGLVDIQEGSIQLGQGGTTGSFGGASGIAVANGAELILDRSNDFSLSGPITGGGLLIKNNTNAVTQTSGGNAVDFELNGGTFLARGGTWSNGFAKNRIITVNSGAILDTASHSLGGLGEVGILPFEIHVNGGTWNFRNEQYAARFRMTGGETTGPGEIRTVTTVPWVFEASTTGSSINNNINMVSGKEFDVEDGAAAVDLLVSGNILNNGRLTKSGSGTMTQSGGIVSGEIGFDVTEGRLNLMGANTNTGDSVVADGAVLELGSPSLDDDSTLTIGETGKVILSHGATDVIKALIINRVSQSPGTYGASGSGATYLDDTNFSGTGLLQVGGGDDFSVWGSAQSWTFGAAGTGRGDDFDRDGFTNEFEYTFGTNPTVPSAGPIVQPLEKAGLTFRYTRRNPALSGMVFTVQTSTNLVSFTADAGATERIITTVGDVQTVEVILSVTAADKLFARVVGATPAL